MIFKNLKTLFWLSVSVNILINSRPLWAMPCPEEMKAIVSNKVVTGDFGRRSRSAVPSDTSQTEKLTPIGDNIIKFEVPPLTVNLSPGEAHKQTEVADTSLEFIEEFKQLIQISSKNISLLSQNDVWILYAEFTKISNFVNNLASPRNGYSRETFEKIRASYDGLLAFIEQNSFFSNLEKMGRTLMPKANEVLRDPFPAKFRKTQFAMEIHFQLVMIEFSLLKNLDEMYSDGFRRRLINGGARISAIGQMITYLKHFNHYLRDIRAEVKDQNTDTSAVIELIEKTEGVLSFPVVERARRFSLQSFFAKTKQLVRELDSEVGQFEVMSHLIKNPGMSHLQIASLPNKSKKGVSDSDVDNLGADLINVIEKKSYQASGDPNIQWATIIVKFSEQVDSSENLNLTPNSKAILVRTLQWLRGVSGDRHAFSREAEDAKVQIRNQVDRLLSILNP